VEQVQQVQIHILTEQVVVRLQFVQKVEVLEELLLLVELEAQLLLE
jgi:hypothetical protein